ncbi:hypothetical protein FJW05_12145 [Mesorhizobium sp. B2-9-1]|uniref:hypothetical protein n=1 Tax=unclassified Mesorhizobium TaxID=325217 RepID=UPI001129E2D4|nr:MULTISPECIES: hypothetical protein [unclassified Mesorhizobium]TPI46897.1 hypothetical protein FJW05_12145 [Mesorhizobium sp. B2-9-1]TPJ81219.1 hypothetical protein FJ419_07260 [Mesorhizobium sp. B2-6-2]
MSSNLINNTLDACRTAIAVFKDRRRNRVARRDFWALGTDECMGLLEDIGMSPSEFEDAMHLPYAAKDFLTLAMRSVGIDPDNFHTLEFAHDQFMSRTCITCPHRRRCHSHLEAFDFESHYREFCPNKDNFSKLLRQRMRSLDGRKPS